MEDFLTMENILTEDEAASLFVSDNKGTPKKETNLEETQTQEETQENNTAEIEEGSNPFMDEDVEEPNKSESVGSVEEGKGKEDTDSKEEAGSPSNSNFYSSIASALKEEGIFPDLDEEEINKVSEAEDFRDLVQRQIQAGLDETQKRIFDALNAGVEPSEVRQYENTIGYLNSITDDQINDESENGENLRRRLLQLDFMNRGYSLERAVKMTEKLFAAGEDIEEAKQALLGNKEYFGGKYQQLLDNAKAEEERQKVAMQKEAEKLKNDILNNDKIFGEIPIDKATRQKVYENISKPVYKDNDTGRYYTVIQKYRKDNESEYIKNVGLLYTITDGFKNLDRLIQPSAKKEVKKKLKELEHTLNNTARSGNGTLLYVSSGNSKSNNSFLDLGFVLDLSK